MRNAVPGLGYVGTVTATGLAGTGHDVVVPSGPKRGGTPAQSRCSSSWRPTCWGAGNGGMAKMTMPRIGASVRVAVRRLGPGPTDQSISSPTEFMCGATSAHHLPVIQVMRRGAREHAAPRGATQQRSRAALAKELIATGHRVHDRLERPGTAFRSEVGHQFWA
jgi:hypothetical protein